MKKGDLVFAIDRYDRGEAKKDMGVVLGFSLDFLLHRYDIPEYEVAWLNTLRVTNVSKKWLRKVY